MNKTGCYAVGVVTRVQAPGWLEARLVSSLHWQQQASPGQENQLSGQARPAAGAGQCSQLTPVSGHLSSGRCTPSTVTTVTSHHWTLQHCRGDSEHWDPGDRDRTVTVTAGL